jgi:DMSO reductase anchor subunit
MEIVNIVKLRQQRIWRLPAVINFTLGSTGAGYYLLATLEAVLAGEGAVVGRGTIDGVIAAACILAGFFALTFEAGNPLKSYLTILNVRHSWMSRELLFALLFFGLVGLNAMVPHPLIRGGAALMAFLFIVSQAFIVYKSRAVLTWNAWPILPIFVFSGGASGYGLLLCLRPAEAARPPLILVGGALLFLCVSVFLYYLFAFRKADADFALATRWLRTPRSLTTGVLVGLLGPLGLLLAASGLAEPLSRSLVVVAGGCTVLGTWWRNRDLITKAGYFRRIQIEL